MAENGNVYVVEPLELPYAETDMAAERYGAQGEDAGWNNPDGGVTVILPNGNSARPEHMRHMRDALPEEAAERGIDLTVVTIEDGKYYDQRSHTNTVITAAETVHNAAPQQDTYIAGWSRGGISATEAAGSVGKLAANGVVKGILTMGTPTIPMNTVETDAPSSLMLPSVSPLDFVTADGRAELLTKSRELGLRVAVTAHAVQRLLENRDGVEAEAEEVRAASIAGQLICLSNRPDFQVVCTFNEDDGIVPAEPHAQALHDQDQPFGGTVLTFPGTHFRPPVDPGVRGALLDTIAKVA